MPRASSSKKTSSKKPASRKKAVGIPTIAELNQPPFSVINVNKAHRAKLTGLEKIAIWVTGQVGTVEFFLLIFFWTVGWLAWNTLAPVELRFDPFPAFVLWLFISNMIQISLMPLIMVGQNLQGRHAEQRAESDFVVNVRARKEIDIILARLEAQEKTLAKILRKLEK
jgi:uncharacterized membrane protein